MEKRKIVDLLCRLSEPLVMIMIVFLDCMCAILFVFIAFIGRYQLSDT